MSESGAVVDPCSPPSKLATPVMGAPNKDAKIRNVRILLWTTLSSPYARTLPVSLTSLEGTCPVAGLSTRTTGTSESTRKTNPMTTTVTPCIATA